MVVLKVIIVCCIIIFSMNVIIGSPIDRQRRDGSSEDKSESDENQQKFYEVDAFGDDYTDFGAITGPKGAFSWHASYPLE